MKSPLKIVCFYWVGAKYADALNPDPAEYGLTYPNLSPELFSTLALI